MPAPEGFVCVKMCAHCRVKAARRPRQLCWKCWATPGVVGNPSPHRTNRRGLHAATNAAPPLATTPTRFRPGTRQKAFVVAFRVHAGFQPFHPGDAPFDLK